MIDVYVCEDNAAQRKTIVHDIQTAILIQEYDMRLRIETDNPQDIIDTIKASGHTGLYFLDIELHKCMNGLLLAKKIREYDPRGFIVFITSHSEMKFGSEQ